MTSSQLQYELPAQKKQKEWHPFLSENLNTRAQQAALIVAESMRDPDFISATLEKIRQQTSSPVNWSPTCPSSGAGLILLYEYAARCFSGQGWDISAQHYLHLAAAHTRQVGISSSALFKGTAGVAFALSQADQREKRYQKTLTRLHRGLHNQVIQRAWHRSEPEIGVADYDYDVFSGAAGTLAYLVSIEQADEYVRAAIEHLLAYLVWLAEPGQLAGKERWYIPSTLFISDFQRRAYPQGKFDCGLANGIAGPLAALSLTCLAGYRYPGLHESIAFLANWLVEHHVDGFWGLDWPDCIPFTMASSPQDWQHLAIARSTWFGGAPGISRSLWLAGQALDDERLRLIAIEAIEAALRRFVLHGGILSPDIYHGVAGLLQICLRFAHESKSILIREHIPVLVEQILDIFDPKYILDFSHLEQANRYINQFSWLTGATGVASVLLAASTSITPTWDRVLVIA